METSNGTNSSDANLGSDHLLNFSVLLMSLSTIATILGNILIVIAILRNSSTRKKLSNRFILSLAFADCCVALFVLPPSISKINHYYAWPYGVAFCKAWVTIDVTFCSASIYNLIGISVDRFYAAYYPIKYASNRSGMMVNLLLLFAWTMPLVISLPMHINHPPFSNWNSLLYENGTEKTDCMPPVDEFSQGWILHAGILAFIIPTILLIVINSLIWNKMNSWQERRVGMAKQQTVMERQATILTDNPDDRFSTNSKAGRKSSKSSKSNTSALDIVNEESSFVEEDGVTTSGTGLDTEDIAELGNKDHDTVIDRIFSTKKKKDLTRAEKKLRKEQAAQKKITTMMSVVIGTFILCWAPFAVMFLLFPFCWGENGDGVSVWLATHPAVIELITWIGYVNSFLNPMIYTIMNAEIRNGVKAIFSDLKACLKK